jgi:hypothetical protein
MDPELPRGGLIVVMSSAQQRKQQRKRADHAKPTGQVSQAAVQE